MDELIKLSKPIDINGVKIDALRMREPTVGDQLDAERLSANEAERELKLFARLCDCADNDLRALALRDYKKLQTAFFRLTADEAAA